MFLFQSSNVKVVQRLQQNYAAEEAALLSFSQGFEKVQEQVKSGSYSQAASTLSKLESEAKSALPESFYFLFLSKIGELRSALEGSGKSLYKSSSGEKAAISELTSMVANDSKLLYLTRWALNVDANPASNENQKANSVFLTCESLSKLDLVCGQEVLKAQFDGLIKYAEKGYVGNFIFAQYALLSTFQRLNRAVAGTTLLLPEVAIIDEKKPQSLGEWIAYYWHHALIWGTNQIMSGNCSLYSPWLGLFLRLKDEEKLKYWADTKKYWKTAYETPGMMTAGMGFSLADVVNITINFIPGYATVDEVIKACGINKTMPAWLHLSLAAGYLLLDVAAFYTGGSTKAPMLLKSIGKGASIVKGEIGAIKLAIKSGDKELIEKAISAYVERMNGLMKDFAVMPKHKLGRITKNLSKEVTEQASKDLKILDQLNLALKNGVEESKLLQIADDLGVSPLAARAKQVEAIKTAIGASDNATVEQALNIYAQNGMDAKKIDKILEALRNGANKDELLALAEKLGKEKTRTKIVRVLKSGRIRTNDADKWEDIAKQAENRLKYYHKEYLETDNTKIKKIVDFADKKIVDPSSRTLKSWYGGTSKFLGTNLFKKKLIKEITSYADNLLDEIGKGIKDSLTAYRDALPDGELKTQINKLIMDLKEFGGKSASAQEGIAKLGTLSESGDLKVLAASVNNNVASFTDALKSANELRGIARKIAASGLEGLTDAEIKLLSKNEELMAAFKNLANPPKAIGMVPLKVVPEKLRPWARKLATHHQVARGLKNSIEANTAINITKAVLATDGHDAAIIGAISGERKSSRMMRKRAPGKVYENDQSTKPGEPPVSVAATEIACNLNETKKIELPRSFKGDRVSVFEGDKFIRNYNVEKKTITMAFEEEGTHVYQIREPGVGGRNLKTLKVTVGIETISGKQGKEAPGEKGSRPDTSDVYKKYGL